MALTPTMPGDPACAVCHIQPDAQAMGVAGASIREAVQRYGLPLSQLIGNFAMQVWMLGWHAGTHAGFQTAMLTQRIAHSGEQPAHPALASLDASAHPWGGH